jgi:tRNA(Ile)-lysidine synthase
VHWGDFEVRRYRDELFLLQPLASHDPSARLAWPDLQPLTLPAGIGELVLEPAESGISKEKWLAASVEVGFRQGGESCIPGGTKHHRALKKLFQEWAVPPWERVRIPLIFINNKLVSIPGYVSCEPFKALPGEEAVLPRWLPSNS